MSSTNGDDQKLVKKAVALLVKTPMLTVPQSMCAAKFTIAQSEDRALQMRVRHAFDIASKNASPMPSMSTVT